MNQSSLEGSDVTQQPKIRKPPPPRRRSSKQASSKDRNGVVFERPNGKTIRAVTPERTSSTLSALPENSRTAYVGQPRDHSGSFSTTDDENTIDSRRRRARTTSSAKDGETASDASPGSLLSKTRKRIGSITTGTVLSSKMEDQVSSIGFPSVMQGSAVSEGEDRPGPKTPRRTFSPDSVSTFASGSVGIKSPTWQESDSNRILHLMKTTCGRMHGILFFRPLHTNAWASGYCAIQVASGSLMCQVKGDVTQNQTLIPDLRGCSVKTHFDPDTQSTYLSVLTASTGSGFQLRPSVPETFDSWLAALLCWQPLRPRGVHNKMTKPQSVSIQEARPTGQRRVSDLNNGRSMAIIKVGQMLSWDGPLPSGSQISGMGSPNIFTEPSDSLLWRRVSCTLHENGAFRLYSEGQKEPVSTTYLSQLSRCAVQRLDQSILEMPYCLAIYPHYTVQVATTRRKRPMILCLETRVAYEAWYVLLRALTVPELYGPEQNASGVQPGQDTRGMFRIEQQLVVKVTEAKFAHSLTETEGNERPKLKRKSTKSSRAATDVYIDIVCGQDLKGRTAIKPCANNVLWATTFTFRDLPSMLNRIAVIVRVGNPGEQEWTMIAHGPYDMSGDAALLTGVGGIEISSHDSVLGKLNFSMEDLEDVESIEKWWPIVDNSNKTVGQVLMRLSLQETVVLMQEEYTELSTLLHNFDNSLTTQIAQLLGPELRQLSEILLDIFQSTDHVHDWLCNLIEEEIDGIHRDTPPLRMRFSGRLQSTDSYENAEQRELLVRDLNRSANQEANLLFRGNSLSTKALDSHMRRLGNDYLEAVLGSRLRKIAERDLDCEVDPIRVRSAEQADRNWSTLLNLTSSIWKAISDSADTCPTALRALFRHVRSCAEDRYGSFIRTVKYTSVSGFLFLRFFCPAILNPQLFGLTTDLPPDRTKRTFTFIAKSLNALASMTKFGTKETWMEPMNKFLTSATPDFRIFIDKICDVSPSQQASRTMEPQYATPMQIKSRLPSASREGLPSLPFLLDSSKLLSDLTELWMAHAPANLAEEPELDQTVKEFHNICTELQARTKENLLGAEQAEKPDKKLEPKWQQVLKEQQQKLQPMYSGQFTAAPANDPELTALPQPIDEVVGSSTGGELISIPATPAWNGRSTSNHNNIRTLTDSTNSSSASIDAVDDGRIRITSSRDGSTKNRLFDLMSSSGRRKGRFADRSYDEGNDH